MSRRLRLDHIQKVPQSRCCFLSTSHHQLLTDPSRSNPIHTSATMSDNNENKNQSESKGDDTKKITMDELKKHDSNDDLWLLIDGKGASNPSLRWPRGHLTKATLVATACFDAVDTAQLLSLSRSDVTDPVFLFLSSRRVRHRPPQSTTSASSWMRYVRRHEFIMRP